MSRAADELSRLESLAKSQSIRVVYSRDIQRGGHCRLRGSPVVLIGSRLGPEERLSVLREGLSRLLPDLALEQP